jgi:hypothetical protein
MDSFFVYGILQGGRLVELYEGREWTSQKDIGTPILANLLPVGISAILLPRRATGNLEWKREQRLSVEVPRITSRYQTRKWCVGRATTYIILLTC